jgi:hypothetical protein
MPQAFSQNDHPPGQYEHFSQVGPSKNSHFLLLKQLTTNQIF